MLSRESEKAWAAIGFDNRTGDCRRKIKTHVPATALAVYHPDLCVSCSLHLDSDPHLLTSNAGFCALATKGPFFIPLVASSRKSRPRIDDRQYPP